MYKVIKYHFDLLGLGSILFAIRIDNEELDNNLKGREMDKQKVSLSEPIISSSIPGNHISYIKYIKLNIIFIQI